MRANPQCYFIFFLIFILLYFYIKKDILGIFERYRNRTSGSFINPALLVLAEPCWRMCLDMTGFSLKLSYFVPWEFHSLPWQIIPPSGCVTGIFSKRQMHRPSRHSVWLTRASHCSWKKQDSFTFAAKKIFNMFTIKIQLEYKLKMNYLIILNYFMGNINVKYFI